MAIDYYEESGIIVYKIYNEAGVILSTLWGLVFCYISIAYLISEKNNLKISIVAGLILLLIFGVYLVFAALILQPRKFILDKKIFLYKVVHLVLPITWSSNNSVLDLDYIHLWRAPEPLFKNKAKQDSTIALINKNKKVVFKDRIEDFELESKIKFLKEHLKVDVKEFKREVYYPWS